MRLLLDTNIVLDVLLNRQPWVVEAQAIWQAHQDDKITCYITATTVTNIFYIARRLTNLTTAYQTVEICLATFEICAVDNSGLKLAVTLTGQDFEDNLQIACAVMNKLDAIVTRDISGFKLSAVPILTPADILSQI